MHISTSRDASYEVDGSDAQSVKPVCVVSPEDVVRAEFYDFLAVLLSSPASRDLLDKISLFHSEKTEFGNAVAALAKHAAVADCDSIEDEFNALFIGLGRGELLPYASYYLTGFLNEKPLAELRREMQQLGIVRSENVFEPEDNIASLCEMMAGLILGRFDTVADTERQKRFFEKHLSAWAGHFFSDLESAKNAVFYAHVGRIGRLFMDIEQNAFRMTA